MIRPGEIVLYTLTEEDARTVNLRKRIGNFVQPGYVLPMIVVVTVPPHTKPVSHPDGCINGQVFLDGEDTLWARSVVEGKSKGQWHRMGGRNEE